MSLRILLYSLLFSISFTSFAAEYREIVLKDGSVISGEVLNFDGSQYTIKSSSLGTVKLDSAQISTIRSPSGASLNSSQAGFSQNDISSIQQQLLSNQDIMAMITSLQNDPQMQAILADPKIMQAIASGDMQTLMNEPKFKQLLDNSTIKQITEKAAQ
jgi:hypothetical protein